MNLTQLWKTGLAVMFGFTLTLSTIGCDKPADDGGGAGGDAAVAPAEGGSGTEGSGEEAHTEGDGHDHADEGAKAEGDKAEAPAPEAKKE